MSQQAIRSVVLTVHSSTCTIKRTLLTNINNHVASDIRNMSWCGTVAWQVVFHNTLSLQGLGLIQFCMFCLCSPTTSSFQNHLCVCVWGGVSIHLTIRIFIIIFTILKSIFFYSRINIIHIQLLYFSLCL